MSGLTTSQAAGVGLLLGSFMMFFIVAAIIYYVLLIIAWWKLFTKAGEKGWKSIIPLYNFYVQCKLTWATKFFWIILAIGVIVGVIAGITPNLNPSVKMPVNIVVFIMYVALAVFVILSEYRLSKAYGHGGGYTVGLIFLNFIFMLILGFGKSEYKGNVYLKEQKKK